MRLRYLVLGLFLFSGVSGLIYEVVWTRLFATVLGTTVYAVSTVLAVFMGGMALGSWLFGRCVDRPGANGVRIYAWLELGVAAYAMALPWLIDLSDILYRAVWPAVSDSFVAVLGLRVLLAGLVLIVPATLMGGTLPVLSRHLVRDLRSSSREIGFLYGVNTIGAVAGVMITGFFLLEQLGLHQTLMLAAGLSAVVGMLAWWASRAIGDVEDAASLHAQSSSRAAYSPLQVRLVLGLYAMSGLGALALEVLWTRSLMYWVSVDTWAFTSMLAAFLCGLGLGSLLFAPFAPRLRRPMLAFGVLQLAVGLSAAASLPLFDLLPEVWESTYARWEADAPLLRKMALKLSSSFLVMLLPTLLMGMSFPVVCGIYIDARRQVGRSMGTLYALNTVGAIAGSLLAGFVLIPTLGVQTGILVIACFYVLSGCVLIAAQRGLSWGRLRPGIAAGAVTSVTLFLLIDTGPIVLQGKEFRGQPGRYELIFANEGVGGSLAVIENEVGTKILNINGVITAINNFRDLQVHRMLSHLPMLLHPNPKKVLVVGFGMGSTVWGCCQHQVERVDVVELIRAERESAPYFADINHGVIEHDKLRFIEGDGRNFLLATPEKYDVISFNAIHPRFSANLYTKDFYELCMGRMTEDGVLCAWLTQNSMLDQEWRGLCGSLVETFPHSSLWFANPEHFCLVASNKELRIDLESWRRRSSSPAVHADLRDSNLDDPYVLLSRYLLGTEALQQYVAGAQINTDDLPIIEFSRESKQDEQTIVAGLVEMKTSILPLIDNASPAEREQIIRYEQSSTEMMLGQIEEWYRGPGIAAKVSYLRGLLITPDNQDLRHYLDSSWLVHRKVETMRAADATDPAPLAFLGKMLVLEGQLDAAETELKSALALRANYPPAVVELGLLYALDQRADDCVRVLGPVARSVRDPRTWYAYALMLAQLGRAEEAARFRTRALTAEPMVAEWYRLRRELLASTR